MSWIGLVTSLVSLVLALVRWLHERDRLRAAEAVVLEHYLQGALNAVEQAKKARADAVSRARSGGLHDDDGFRRD